MLKRFLVAVLSYMAMVVMGQSLYTLSDVAKHASVQDCWMVLNGTQVYNFTTYLSKHPGGTAMVPYCGKDGSLAFDAIKNHGPAAIALESAYLIGMLSGAPPTPPPPPPPPPPPVLVDLLPHNDTSHFARHAYLASRDLKQCLACHAVGKQGRQTAVAHGVRVFPLPRGGDWDDDHRNERRWSRFTGPVACYTSPYMSPSHMHPDPYGDTLYPEQICTGRGNSKAIGLGIYNNGTPIRCSDCHSRYRDHERVAAPAASGTVPKSGKKD